MDYVSTVEDLTEEVYDSNGSFLLNATYTEEMDSEVNSVIIPTISFLLCAFGLSANVLTLYVAVRHAKLNKGTNLYIFNLAMGDVLVMFGVLFTASNQAMLYWPFGSFLCKLVMVVDFINPIASMFFITVMSIDRCVAMYDPEASSKWQKVMVAILLILVIWFIAFLFVLPVIIFAATNEFDQCIIVWPDPGITWDATFTICLFALGFCLPIVVTSFSFLLLAIKAKPPNPSVDPTSCREPEGTRLVVGLFVVFVVCWLPLNIQSIIDVTGYLPVDFVRVYDFFVILTYAKSCISPILYGFLSDDFKQGFRSLSCC